MPRSAHATEGWEAERDVSQTLSQLCSKQPKAALSGITANALWEVRTTLEGHWLLLGRGDAGGAITPCSLAPRCATATAPLGFLKLCFNPFKTFVPYGGTGTVG